jgi:transaldolase/glucose-6-phosphate isomerase
LIGYLDGFGRRPLGLARADEVSAERFQPGESTPMATVTSSPLAALQALGQSVWLDDISRKMLDAGELRRLIEEDGLQGMTSNPSIFQKAIGSGTEYDDEVQTLIGVGNGIEAIYEDLTAADIRRALDEFRPVYDRTGGGDGFVSLEVSPLLAHDTAATIAEAKKLWDLLGRPNAMIKIPGTPEGLPAIEEALFSGLNVNVTLLFSVEAYSAVAKTYIKALKRRAEKGLPIDRIASVASFFVSRIDTEVDNRLEAKLKEAKDPAAKAKIEGLLGKAATANAKNAYTVFEQLFHGPDFASLKAKGAKVQRVLWASVSTKNKKYPDTLYTDGLIGPQTVSTMPMSAFDAFKDHGHASNTLLEGRDAAVKVMSDLASVGVDYKDVTDKLLRDGVRLFADAFHGLFATIGEKRSKILQHRRIGQTLLVGDGGQAVEETLADLEKLHAVERMWSKDATLWKSDEAHAKVIKNALGWLNVAGVVREKADELTRFGREVADAGFTHIVVMGMGGSSLCVEVLRRTNIPVAGHPELIVLDSTVPATIRRVESEIDVAKTLFVVSSKSGTTTEPSVFYATFFEKVKAIKGEKAGENFVAITDPGTKMEADARRDGFRRIFLNPSDIGGRYSALSYFGMVPAALMGLDVATILDHAKVAIHECGPEIPVRQNPGAALGAVLGTFATKGRDKVTLITPPPLEALGLWIEQLIAESTGKEGRGILPVAGEPVAGPEAYGNDRVFVQIRTNNATALENSPLLQALARAGHPVLDLVMADPSDLGAEFFRWEIAVPIAGQRIGIDPFDQPNVQESKDNTKALLAAYVKDGKLPGLKPLATFEGLTFSVAPEDQSLKANGSGREAAVGLLKAHLGRVKPGDYVAVTQYIDERPARDETIQAIRTALRDRLKVATTTGYGPRFLHSTGQLHKGGSDAGVFLQLTASDGQDVLIPGQPFGYAVLVEAQALGDFQSLAKRQRRALNVHLGQDADKGLATLKALLTEAVK